MKIIILLPVYLVFLSEIILCKNSDHAAKSCADEVSISVEFLNTELKDAISEIINKSGCSIVFKDNLVKDKLVTYRCTYQKVSKVLEGLLLHTGLYFNTLDSGQIIILKMKSKNVTIKGFILDYDSSNPLPNANVFIENSPFGTSSDVDGYFELKNVQLENHKLIFQYVGYKEDSIYINPDKDIVSLNVILHKITLKSPAIIIRDNKNIITYNRINEINKLTITPNQIDNLSSIGESDIINGLNWIPGVQSSIDGIQSMHVLGGDEDQNLILFNDIPIYQSTHLFGLISSFNPDVISNINFYQGGFPAKFGGRTSSVLLLTSSNNDTSKFKVSAGLNALSANSFLHYNYQNRLSVSIAFRRSYTDWLDNGSFNNLYSYVSDIDTARTNSNSAVQQNKGGSNINFYYYDINAILHYKFFQNDQLTLSFIKGYDWLDNSFDKKLILFSDDSSSNTIIKKYLNISKWESWGISSRWDHYFSNQFYSSLVAVYSKNQNNLEEGIEKYQIIQDTLEFEENSIEEFTLKLENNWHINNNLMFDFGIDISQVQTNNIKKQNNFHETTSTQSEILSTHLQLNKNIFNSLNASIGLRVTKYSLNDQIYFAPCLNFNYQLSDYFSLSASYGRYYQFISMRENGSILKGDKKIWQLVFKNNEPEFVNSLIFGLIFENELLHANLTTYYRDLKNLKEYYNDPNSILDNPTYTNSFMQCNGIAKGIQLSLMKMYNPLQVLASYTLSKVDYSIPGYNNNKPYLADYDRTHEFKTVGIWTKNDWQISLSWLYSSGAPYTPMIQYSIRSIEGVYVNKYYPLLRNSDRLPDYHRMDISFSKVFFINSYFINTGLSIYNVYGQQNIIYRKYINIESEIRTHDTKMIGILPAIFIKFGYKS